MWQPVAEINTCICYIDNVSDTLGVTYYPLKVTSRNMIRSQSRRTTVLIDNVIDFSAKE